MLGELTALSSCGGFWGRLLCTDIRYYATGEFKEDLLVLRNPLEDNRENFAIEVVTGQLGFERVQTSCVLYSSDGQAEVLVAYSFTLLQFYTLQLLCLKFCS